MSSQSFFQSLFDALEAYFPACSPVVKDWLAELSMDDFALTQKDSLFIPSTHIIEKLNRLKAYNEHATLPRFAEQAQLQQHDTRYYEEFIVEDKVVPTRAENWHDLYNALVWQRFPRLKWAMSKRQYSEIKRAGLHPRTKLRNYLTHLDECGLLLAVPKSKCDEAQSLLTALANHQWERAFVTLRNDWHHCVFPLMVGHANLEMLMSPFSGLTGKWLAVVVDDDFAKMPIKHQYMHVGGIMANFVDNLTEDETGSYTPKLLPIPLLAVPAYLTDFAPEMLKDTSYFRPLPHYREVADSVIFVATEDD